jgi:hypothetical protein
MFPNDDCNCGGGMVCLDDPINALCGVTGKLQIDMRSL